MIRQFWGSAWAIRFGSMLGPLRSGAGLGAAMSSGGSGPSWPPGEARPPGPASRRRCRVGNAVRSGSVSGQDLVEGPVGSLAYDDLAAADLHGPDQRAG